jgi:hypothetical protein
MWMTFPVGRSFFHVSASISRQKSVGWVQLVIFGADHVEYFRVLEKSRRLIESEIGQSLEWRELPDGKESHVRQVFADFDMDNRSDWPRQHKLFRTT